MEIHEKRYSNIIEQLQLLAIQTKSHNDLYKKDEDYLNAKKLIDEANIYLDSLEDKIKNINISSIQNITQSIDDYIKMIDIPNPKFNEIIYVITHLQALYNKLPSSVQIIDNIENDMINIKKN